MNKAIASLGLALVGAVSAAGEVRYLSAVGDDAADGGTALLRRGDVFYGGLRLPAGTDASHPTVPADYRIRDNVLRRVQGQPAGDGICPFVPYKFKMGGAVAAAADLRDISKRMGFRRFLLSGPGFDEVMYAPFAADLYAKMGAEMAEVKRLLSDTDIELGWWCAPSIRYVSGFASIEDASGNKSKDNKKCPLDPAFQSDWSAKVKSVAAAFRPRMINVEDDYTLAWGRGLDGCACFCPRRLASFASRYGKALTGPEIAAAFASRTKENEPIRRAFAETARSSAPRWDFPTRRGRMRKDPS